MNLIKSDIASLWGCTPSGVHRHTYADSPAMWKYCPCSSHTASLSMVMYTIDLYAFAVSFLLSHANLAVRASFSLLNASTASGRIEPSCSNTAHDWYCRPQPSRAGPAKSGHLVLPPLCSFFDELKFGHVSAGHSDACGIPWVPGHSCAVPIIPLSFSIAYLIILGCALILLPRSLQMYW